MIRKGLLTGLLAATLAGQDAGGGPEPAAPSPAAPGPAAPGPIATGPVFYRPLPYGTSFQWTPLNSMITWCYDTLQVPESFDEYQLRERWGTVRHNLTHPGDAVRQRGSWADFVNRQVIPYRMTEKDWIPNWSLHLLGGGMVYRKTAEWLEAQGAPAPWALSALWCMTAEVYQEVIEKASTKPDDEVADVLLFRPAGMLLYAYEPFARWVADTLHLQEWNHQPMWDPDQPRPINARGRLVNVGQNFMVRPEWLGSRDHRPFVYFGLTSLFGLSHRITATDSLSWGYGGAVVHAQDPTVARAAGGLFWDRNGSLLASLILNGTDDLKARLNIYPGIVGEGRWWSPGLYVGLGRNREVQAGLTLRILPVGWARGNRQGGATPPRLP